MRRFAIAIAWGLCMIPLTYATMRIVQARFYPDPDPRFVIPGAKIAMFWRCAVGAMVGSVVAIVAHAMQRRHAEQVERWLSACVTATIVLVVVQAAFSP